MKSILVVGGAGYIGSHMVKMLSQEGYHPITLDDFSTGFRQSVRYGDVFEGSMADTFLLERIFTQYNIEAVMHFASFSQVGESMVNPQIYYRNNVYHTLELLQAVVKFEVKNFIFSSTAAVYGNPRYTPIDELHAKHAINPYGRSKSMVENILADFEHAYGLKFVTLRYFNAAGADPNGELGECHDPETHLIPLVLQAALGQRDSITIFGDDYNTKDGTCIRDYIHVTDLCSAHLLALESLLDGEDSEIYNLGNGSGYSVKDVISTVEDVLDLRVPVKMGARRAGDPEVLVANADKALHKLGWQPRWSGLPMIVQHAANWEKQKSSKPAPLTLVNNVVVA